MGLSVQIWNSFMRVRSVQRDDLPAIVAISNWAAEHTAANFAIEPESLESWVKSWEQTQRMYPWLVAELDGGPIIGFAKASSHKGRCAYAWTAEVSVYVHPEHHGQGIGTKLYGKLIPILKAQGYVTLLAGITSPNPASEKLHRTFGFRRVGVFERVGWKFNQWHNVGYWEVLLRDGDAEPLPVRTVADYIV